MIDSILTHYEEKFKELLLPRVQLSKSFFMDFMDDIDFMDVMDFVDFVDDMDVMDSMDSMDVMDAKSLNWMQPPSLVHVVHEVHAVHDHKTSISKLLLSYAKGKPLTSSFFFGVGRILSLKGLLN